MFDRLLTEGAVTGFEIEVKRRDGERIIVLISSRIIRDRAGQPLYVESFLADITNSKRAEQALLDARAQLAHVARVMTLGEMAASIAHEVRQPLAAVVLNARAGMRWLARQPADLQAARKTLEAIVSDSQRTAEVIARIRAWAKRTPPETDSLDVNEVITEVVALTRSEASRHRVALETRLDNDVPLVKGDRVSLEQVVVNLVMNAVESIAAAGDGPRELIICSGRSELGDVLVAVRDTGKGLQPEHRERIFEAFFTTKATGLGMGLRISRTIIEGHGGRLWATANSPRGAVFSFTLPSRDKAAAAQQTTPSAAVQ